MNTLYKVREDTGELGEPVPFLRTPHNYNMDAASDETGLICPEPTMAQQQFKEETDINIIVERFGLTGELPTAQVVPVSGDFANVMTYQEALNKIREAEEAFMEMPATIRAEFGNDPAKFVSFMDDPKNKDKAKEWGLLRSDEVAPQPYLVKIVPEATGEPPGGSKGDA